MEKTLKRRSGGEYAASAPSVIWLTLLFLVPTLIIFAVSLRSKGSFGGIGEEWTLDTLRSLANPNYPEIIWRTLWLSVTCTAVTMLLAVPIAYYMARCKPWKRGLMMLLTIIPFWTNFLIRIFAWKLVLHPDGALKHFLVWLNILDQQTPLLYNPGAVLVVMIYTELPFAILPIYAAAEKFDFSLFEAAMDLGAGRLYSFVKVFIPGIADGILSACLMVFIPCIGSYVIPDLVGGTDGTMMGNVIVRLILENRNLPAGAAVASVMTLVMFLPLFFFLKGKRSDDGTAKPAKEVV